MSDERPAHVERTVWDTLWTTAKLLAVLIVCVPIAILMLTSSQPTETPAAAANPSPTIAPARPVATVVAGSTPTPTIAKQDDVFVPGALVYVQGRTLIKLHHYDSPVRLVANATMPSVSPNGKRIAYVEFHKNYQNLMLVDLSTFKSQTFLDNSPTDPIDPRTGLSAGAPAWSDDGRQIYFTWNNPGTRLSGNETDLSLYRCALSGPCNGNTANVVDNENFTYLGGDAEVAPRLADPSTIVFSKFQEQQSNPPISQPELVAENSDTGVQTVISDPAESASEPVWSPNGRDLAFVKATANAQSDAIYVMPFHPPGQLADYKAAALLVQGAPFVSHPVFSPDGHYLAYLANDPTDTGFHLYITRVHLGQHPHVDRPQLVKRAGIVDSASLVWTTTF